jgi:hypothetical protein
MRNPPSKEERLTCHITHLMNLLDGKAALVAHGTILRTGMPPTVRAIRRRKEPERSFKLIPISLDERHTGFVRLADCRPEALATGSTDNQVADRTVAVDPSPAVRTFTFGVLAWIAVRSVC